MHESDLMGTCACPVCGHREEVFTQRSACLYVRCPRCDVWMRQRH